MTYQFKNRTEAGQKLAEALYEYKGAKNTLVLGLPRGGVPVAFEVAKELSLPLDILLVRKLGVPGHEELAMGAIAWGNINYINRNVIRHLKISEISVNRVMEKEKENLARLNNLYRGHRSAPEVQKRTVIIIDDGIATGATMRVAIAVMHKAKARRIVVAAPVGSESTCKELEHDADDVICVYTPEPFYGVGQWYSDFSQTSDEEVQRLLLTSSNDNNTPNIK